MSRLTKQVRTSSGLAYSVGSYNYLRPLGGTYFSYCLTRADAMAQATTMMMDIIREVKKNGITAEEMEIARDAVINSSIFEYDTPSKIVTAKARLEYLGFPPRSDGKKYRKLQGGDTRGMQSRRTKISRYRQYRDHHHRQQRTVR